MAYLGELKERKKTFEAKTEELTAKELAKLEVEKQKIDIGKCEAALKLKKVTPFFYF